MRWRAAHRPLGGSPERVPRCPARRRRGGRGGGGGRRRRRCRRPIPLRAPRSHVPCLPGVPWLFLWPILIQALQDLVLGGKPLSGAAAGPQPTRAPAALWQDMWKEVAPKELRARLKPGLVWLEIGELGGQAPRAQPGCNPSTALCRCIPSAARSARPGWHPTRATQTTHCQTRAPTCPSAPPPASMHPHLPLSTPTCPYAPPPAPMHPAVSYIKGSAEAVRTPEGRLGLEHYLELGRKRGGWRLGGVRAGGGSTSLCSGCRPPAARTAGR